METLNEQVKNFNKEETILLISSQSKELEEKKKQLEELQAQIDELEECIDHNKTLLLEIMKEDEEVEYRLKCGDDNYLFANLFSKNEFSYGDEKALLSKLQEMKLDKYIKTTTTTKIAIDKNALKKDLKVDTKLKEDLKDFVGDRLVEYVTVTTPENHQKMLEHIEENKK